MLFTELFFLDLVNNAENIFYFLVIINIIFLYFFVQSLIIRENEHEN
jgi:hypothetical protein